VVSFVLKVLVASAAIAIALKFLAPLLPLPTTAASALTLVLLPPGIVALLLGKRMQQDEQ
jgi:hypothetical protein